MPADVGYYFFGIGAPVEDVGGVVAVSAYSLSSGWMNVTDYSRSDIDGNGQEFIWTDMALAVSYGRYLTDRFSVGVSLKLIMEDVHESSARGWSADVGTLYNTGFRGFKIGMVITNFGPDLRMQTASYPLPINFKFGGAINAIESNDNVLTLSAEGWHPSDNLEKYNVGGEWTYKDRFSLRAGGRINYDISGLTFGGGVKMPFGEEREIRVDYAWQDFGILTQVHRFTLGIAF
jgi:long-subunit fatty acid transport protein